MKGKKILVIGGSGFLGSRLVQKLGEQAVIADCLAPSYVSESPYINLNLLNKHNINKTISEFDFVINCVGQITTPINDCFKINTEGIFNLVSAVNSSNSVKLFQVSTVSVYGTTINANELTKLNPETPYASIKAFAEFIISNTCKKKYCIIRIPNIYGNGQQKGVFAYFKRSFISDKKLEFQNNGDLLRYYLHVEDVADAIICAVRNNISGLFNLTSDDRYTIRDLINLIEKYHNIKFESSFGINQPQENIEFLDGSKFKEATNFSPLNKVEDYIKLF